MKKIIFCLILMAFFAPASIVLSCSMGMEMAGQMMNHDATMNQNMEHMNHQGDMMAQDPDVPNIVPETNTTPTQPKVEPEPSAPEPQKSTGLKRYYKTRSSSHDHSLP